MNLKQAIATTLGAGIEATAAGTNATTADPRPADEWIKQWMDRRQESLNEMRQKLSRTFDPEPERETEDVDAAVHDGKPTRAQQMPWKTSEGGRWAVTDPDGLIISTHHEREDAQRAATAKRYARVVDLGANDEYRKKYLVPESDLNKQVDDLRKGLGRYPGRSGGAAGTGGTGTGG